MVLMTYDKIGYSDILLVRRDIVISHILLEIFRAILEDLQPIDRTSFKYGFKYVSVNFHNFSLISTCRS